MPKERGEACDHRGFGAEARCEPDRQCALRGIEQEGQRGEFLAAGAQHVGRADIAGADVADVAKAGKLREDQAERNRAQQVPDGGGEQVGEAFIHG